MHFTYSISDVIGLLRQSEAPDQSHRANNTMRNKSIFYFTVLKIQLMGDRRNYIK